MTNIGEVHIHEKRLSIYPGETIGILGAIEGLADQMHAMHTHLASHITTLSGTPWIVTQALSQFSSSKTTLRQLSNILNTNGYSPERAGQLSVEQMIATSTNAIRLFGRMQVAFTSAITTAAQSSLQHNTWHDRESDLSTLLDSLSTQDTTFKLQLNLLTCPSEDEAHQTRNVLDSRLSTLLEEKPELREQLQQLEQETLLASQDVPELPQLPSAVLASQHGLLPVRNPSIRDPDMERIESILKKSRAYRRRAAGPHDDAYTTTSARRGSVWSELSTISLAQADIVAIIALPVRVSELADDRWFKDRPAEQTDQEGNLEWILESEKHLKIVKGQLKTNETSLKQTRLEREKARDEAADVSLQLGLVQAELNRIRNEHLENITKLEALKTKTGISFEEVEQLRKDRDSMWATIAEHKKMLKVNKTKWLDKNEELFKLTFEHKALQKTLSDKESEHALHCQALDRKAKADNRAFEKRAKTAEARIALYMEKLEANNKPDSVRIDSRRPSVAPLSEQENQPLSNLARLGRLAADIQALNKEVVEANRSHHLRAALQSECDVFYESVPFHLPSTVSASEVDEQEQVVVCSTTG